MTSPTQHSIALLKKEGYTVAITEHFNAFARIRQDLYGFIDMVAIKPGEILAVQCTSKANINARITKIIELPISQLWCTFGRIQVMGWQKKGFKYEVIRKEITYDMKNKSVMVSLVGEKID